MEKYRDPSRPIAERVDDLIGRMTVREKVMQLTCVYAFGGMLDFSELGDGIGQVAMSHGSQTIEQNIELVNRVQKHLVENTRLGIPALFHVETLNGGALTGATVYPIPLGLAASFDDALVHKMTSEIRREMTACGQKLALAPVLDISRDPRWGRQGETYGESPTLAAAMGSAYISGIQGGLGEDGMASCAKHFLGYAASEGGINMAGAHIGPRELREVYAKPFAAAIDNAGLQGVMNCYLAVDGEPVTGTKKYLTELLRGELGFDGCVVADYGSIDKLFDVYHIAEDYPSAGAMALSAGLDVETPRRICLDDEFIRRAEAGEIPMETIDTALRRHLTLKFKLGLFEKPYADLEAAKSLCGSEAHTATSLRLARESMTLLKNERGILPLRDKKRIAVVGPNADNVRALFGGYTYPAFYESMRDIFLGISENMGLEGVGGDDEQMAALKNMISSLPEVNDLIRRDYKGVKTVLEAVRSAAPSGTEIVYARGCGNLETDDSGFGEAIRAAAESEVTLYICGGRNGSADGCTMGENVDASHIGLPGCQEQLLHALAETGTPLVVVHMDGRPLSSVYAAEHAAAILEAWHPGQMGAEAVADTLFGKSNPSGRLPATAVRHSGQVPIYAEQNRGSGVLGRGQSNNNITQGYVDEPGFPLWPFGHGLSYTTFEISDLRVSSGEMPPDGRVTVSCTVKNTGHMAGADIVELWFRDKAASVVRPNKELAGFARVELAPGESREVCFNFYADETAFLDSRLRWIVEVGEVELLLGDTTESLTPAGTVRITESKALASGRRHYFAERA